MPAPPQTPEPTTPGPDETTTRATSGSIRREASQPGRRVPHGRPVPQTIATLESVSKLYGHFAALRKLSCTFESGCCYILLGANGAGKSTLLRVLAGLLTPTAGRILVFGQEPKEARARIGYMSHAPMLYDELSAAENLQYFAALYPGVPTLSAAAALAAVGLDPALHRPVAQYSQGMRQRTSLARVLLTQPDLLLLDEPFSNMDAASAAQMLALIGRMRDEGRTVLLTTHQRELAEPIADVLLTMHAGALISTQAAGRAVPQT